MDVQVIYNILARLLTAAKHAYSPFIGLLEQPDPEPLEDIKVLSQ